MKTKLEKQTEAVAAMAAYLSGESARKSIALEMERGRGVNALAPAWGEEWARLRNAFGVHGWATEEEAAAAVRDLFELPVGEAVAKESPAPETVATVPGRHGVRIYGRYVERHEARYVYALLGGLVEVWDKQAPHVVRTEAEVVRWFARRMNAELEANSQKGGVRAWRKDTLKDLLERLREESGELAVAVSDLSSEKKEDEAISEAADVANFAMMVADWIAHRRIGRVE